MNERDNPAVLWPTYALRAWLTALLAETRRSRLELDARVEHYEKEIARIAKQKERSERVVESLLEAIVIVDNVLRGVRDTEVRREEKEEHAHETERHKEGESHHFESKGEPASSGKLPPERRRR